MNKINSRVNYLKMKKTFVILPQQLFDKKYLDKNKYKYIIYEHPHYFLSYNYNKKKLLLHRASMKYYFDYLKENDFEVIRYIDFNKDFKVNDYIIFDPIDKIKLTGNYEMMESPNFLLNKEIYKKYREKTNKFFFTPFYMWSKKEINIIPDIKSTDKENRENELKEKIPKIPKISTKYIKKSEKYVNDNFCDNTGTTQNFNFPISHEDAKRFLSDFVKHRLNHFGEYQDIILKNDEKNIIFHSYLSSSLNIGLLNPIDVIKVILKTKTKMNNKEGFIRQLFWREYQRYCYIYCNFNSNYFNNTKKLTKDWYYGTTNILPVDNCIKKAFDNGYLHHIERLMIMGNYMNLCNINPKQGFKWFMEFSCDSYLWVMHQNVLDMAFFCTGGKTMRRPYISSSNYILKMSDYERDDWCDIWDDKYKEFINRNKKKLYKFRYFVNIKNV